MKGQFNKYVDLIRSISWKIAKRYGAEYDDVEAQGFLIYCTLMESYDMSKASFSTYLYIQLWGRLKDYAGKMKSVADREGGVLMVQDDDEWVEDSFLTSVESRDYDLNNDELFRRAKNDLDNDSFKVFEYVASFEWRKAGRAMPTVTSVMRKFNVSRERAGVLWGRCRDFWLKSYNMN